MALEVAARGEHWRATFWPMPAARVDELAARISGDSQPPRPARVRLAPSARRGRAGRQTRARRRAAARRKPVAAQGEYPRARFRGSGTGLEILFDAFFFTRTGSTSLENDTSFSAFDGSDRRQRGLIRRGGRTHLRAVRVQPGGDADDSVKKPNALAQTSAKRSSPRAHSRLRIASRLGQSRRAFAPRCRASAPAPPPSPPAPRRPRSAPAPRQPPETSCKRRSTSR